MKKLANQVENNSANDESDHEVYMSSMTHISINIEYIRRKNVQYFRPFINIKTIKNKFIFIP